MIRKGLADITYEEFETISKPYHDNFFLYIENYVLTEVVVFSIASSFERNALWESFLLQEYNSIKDTILIYNEDKDKFISKIKELFKY